MYKSGGCIGVCSFCGIHKYYNTNKIIPWISRDPYDVANEMIEINKDNNKNEKIIFDFVDDDILGIKPEDWLIISKIIKKNKLENKIEIWGSSRVDVFSRNEKIIKEMSSIGLKGIFLGFESALEKDIKLYKKNLTLFGESFDVDNYKQMLSQAKKICEKFKMRFKLGNINIHSDTTLSELKESINFIKYNDYLYDVEGLVRKLCIYKKTGIYNLYKKNNKINNKINSKNWLDKRTAYTIQDKEVEYFAKQYEIFYRETLKEREEILIKTRFISLDSQKNELLKLFNKLRDLEYEFVTKLLENNLIDTQKYIMTYIKLYNEGKNETY
jgi:radical SAM superfamily enzyme YgiQ (UPF0313 family)